MVRPILEMVFDEGPNTYQFNYGLPGENQYASMLM